MASYDLLVKAELYCMNIMYVQGVRKKDTHHFVSFFKARASIFSKLAIIVDWRMAKKMNAK